MVNAVSNPNRVQPLVHSFFSSGLAASQQALGKCGLECEGELAKRRRQSMPAESAEAHATPAEVLEERRRKQALAAVMSRATLASLQNPFSLDFLRALDPDYRGINPKTFRDTYLPQLHQEAEESLRDNLQGADFVSLAADGGKKRYLYFTIHHAGGEWFVGFWNSGAQAKDTTNTVLAIEEKVREVEEKYGVVCAGICLDNEPKNRAVREALYKKHYQYLLICPPCYLHGAQLFGKDISQDSVVVRTAILYAETISHFILLHTRVLSDWEAYSKELLSRYNDGKCSGQKKAWLPFIIPGETRFLSTTLGLRRVFV